MFILRPKWKDPTPVHYEDTSQSYLPSWIYWPKHFLMNVWRFAKEEILLSNKIPGKKGIFFKIMMVSSLLVLLFNDPMKFLREHATYLWIPMLLVFALTSFFRQPRRRIVYHEEQHHPRRWRR